MLAAVALLALTGAGQEKPVWWETELNILKREGLLSDYSTGFHSPPLSNRWEAAIATYHAHQTFRIILEWEQSVGGFDNLLRTVARGVDVGEATTLRNELVTIKGFQPSIHRVKRLVVELKYEMSQLTGAVSTKTMLQEIDRVDAQFRRLRIPRVGEAKEPFPDVPANHWAAEAVQTMKQEGILRGYPTGRFSGR